MFAPMSASVAPGATVRVTNKDSVDHTLTATGGQFDTGDIGDGQTKTFTAPTKPGTLPLHLQHPPVHDGHHRRPVGAGPR